MPVSMMFQPKVSRSTMAAHKPGVGEGLGPAGERLVGGDGDRVLLLAFGEDLEQELGSAAVELHASELIDAEQVDAAVAGNCQQAAAGCTGRIARASVADREHMRLTASMPSGRGRRAPPNGGA